MNSTRLRHDIASAFQIVKERSTEEEICIVCPVPGCQDKSGNRYINVKTLLTHCYRCEGKSPGHVKSLFHLTGVEFAEDTLALEPADLQELLRDRSKPALTPVQNIELPEGFSPLRKNRSSCYWKFCQKMAERKHLTIRDLEDAEAGFTRIGFWEPFCIFPTYEGGRTVYYQGRTYLDDNTDSTKKFPSKKDVPYGARYWIYGLDALADPSIRMVIVVESILNLLSLKKKLRETSQPDIMPICVFTHFLSRSQVTKMQRYPHIKEWCLLFDSDSTGLAESTALKLNALLPASVAKMPPGLEPDGTVRETNDANDDVEAAMKAIDKRHAPSDAATISAKLRTTTRKTVAELLAESL